MERRSYRSTTPPKEEALPTNEPEKPKNYKPQNSRGDSKFINITGLFKSKSGKADTVFVTEAIEDILHSIQPGDTLGVSENQKNGNLQLWFIKGEPE